MAIDPKELEDTLQLCAHIFEYKDKYTPGPSHLFRCKDKQGKIWLIDIEFSEEESNG